MIKGCPNCSSVIDDARQSTLCPHKPFLSKADARQKDLALTLIGKDVRFNHMTEPGSKTYRVMAVSWDGMVQLEGMGGQFAPHLFVTVDSKVGAQIT